MLWYRCRVALPSQSSGSDHPCKIRGAMLHNDVESRLFPVDDAVVVAHDKRVTQLSKDIDLQTVTTSTAGQCETVRRASARKSSFGEPHGV